MTGTEPTGTEPTGTESTGNSLAAPVVNPAFHRPRFRAGVIVSMGLAAALVTATTGAGLYFSSMAVAQVVAAASSSNSSTSGTSSSGSVAGSTGSSGTSGSSATLGTSGLRPGGPSNYGSGTASATTATALDTTAATAAQSVGVVVIDTVLKYQSAEAAGTGIVLTSNGEILTNNHVIDGATSISVTVVSTGVSYVADVVGTDSSQDIAVLKLENASGLVPATLDTTSTVAAGDAVTGVGNAGGTSTLTAAAGTVTSVDQTITASSEDATDAETLTGLIQVDADIQSGDSGGPLYDADGEVIGIDTAASSGTATISGFAITIDAALEVVTLIHTGVETSTVTIGYPAFLGVAVGSGATTSTDTGSVNGRSYRGSLGAASGTTGSTATTGDSAVITAVVAGSAAATAGIVAGDTITAVDGTSITSAAALTSTLTAYNPGDSVTLTWTDTAGAPHTASATLTAGPAD
ncbi:MULTISPECIES: S1C family serine protease [unclassified Cryobacterium]|uniref:S1C family serine protease n=1 Tax=unclassified Cryobacterium TaxID=2649013 RepID=UPI00106A3389|nr:MULTISPECIES: trypsin-like peptidase domain-containing protein [unclassified Cryobacterium]TFB99202.1 trypsin-like serine protease [Cryobacterium sp. MDB2-A-1]TFC06657.1 trypsin-like serine protease [Cryobacterium sp. MDB2-33-2]TFC13910.1 trypsin-like serine protease [Cryobacterium sp. MDB2-10]TFC15820.1 trypsin-like serine protease [Cryobacterium sp. MDB2-A-2]